MPPSPPLNANFSFLLQMADMMNLYSNLVERCFMSCAKDMSSKTLSTKEEDCTRHCADKFFNMSSRCAIRH